MDNTEIPECGKSLRRTLVDVYLDIVTLEEEGARRKRHPNGEDISAIRVQYKGALDRLHGISEQLERYIEQITLRVQDGLSLDETEIQYFHDDIREDYRELKDEIKALFLERSKGICR